MNRKIRVGILFGGRSAEHEVSLQSAKNVIEAIDKKKYEVVLIGIDKKGRWYLSEASRFLLHADNPNLIKLNKANESVVLVPGRKVEQLVSLSDHRSVGPVDVVFPVLHGPFGEDGTVQGLLKLANIPFVGAGVLGSAIGMDKDVMKRLLRDAGIPTAKFLVFARSSLGEIDFEEVKNHLSLPFFIKPANLGSSVGINKVIDKKQFEHALKDAFEYDNKILIEEYIEGREIECSVLGNDNPIASVPGEVIPQHEFYSYEAKYIDENGAILEIPARLPEHIINEVQDLAIKTFKTLCCEGMARVDFFLRNGTEVIVNELNTIPGFTTISMYPKLWEASGISCTELIDRLIQLALERFEREQKLKTSFEL
ncbi:D-alanine--D-alanine ligase [candidate division KSB1 bacterium]|nr:D-alanine--D-alanine ligase [bacterium]OQX56838.1 MAG: D-alanine--D-alanine ligase A [candidate division KSB1 bacterium 4484_219]RKY75660.1 MAG: D-alanine--D-alanine ligase [candidate division KSB1 bacterium]